jgi:hypothetical protein
MKIKISNLVRVLTLVIFLVGFCVSTGCSSNSPVDVVVAGYTYHSAMQPTVSAVKEVLAKYGDKVKTTWINLDTSQGGKYFQDHKLTAHMNIIINGKSTYKISGKDVTFQWFEGQQWTKQDLDTILSNLTK